MPHLQYLNVGYCPLVTDKGLYHLSKGRLSTQFRHLDLSATLNVSLSHPYSITFSMPFSVRQLLLVRLDLKLHLAPGFRSVPLPTNMLGLLLLTSGLFTATTTATSTTKLCKSVRYSDIGPRLVLISIIK